MKEIWVYNYNAEQPVFILHEPSPNLLRKLKLKGFSLIPKIN